MKKIIAINGEAWCRNLTGIERVTIETVQELDKICKKDEIELILPANALNIPELNNIKIVQLPKEAHFMPKWTQFVYQSYVIKNKRISLDFSNTCPFFVPGIEYIHDIYCKLYPGHFKSKRERFIQIYSNMMYKTIAKRAKKVITVSEFSKKTIIDTYKTKPDKIEVIYGGLGSSYNLLQADFSIFDKLPVLKEKNFYFTLGSLSIRKNLKWIADHAKLYPDDFFAISGKSIGNVESPDLAVLQSLPNVIFTGYLSDSEVKALFSKCKAFIFPSTFEGFGLPPLEALSCGAKIILSNASCLPEIYGSTAYYINPENPDVNLSELMKNEVIKADKLLEKLTFENSAKQLYGIIQQLLCN